MQHLTNLDIYIITIHKLEGKQFISLLIIIIIVYYKLLYYYYYYRVLKIKFVTYPAIVVEAKRVISTQGIFL